MNTASSQQAVTDFLGQAETHGGVPAKRIDTHAATVFLAGSRALKIKRAVRFPFLDFSTLEKRKAACEAELAVNRPFAPAIYRGIVAITREADGNLAIGGRGEPVEWAVGMNRFDENQTLDRLAEMGRIDDRMADSLGRAVAQAHAKTPPVAEFDFAAALEEIAEQNIEELRNEPVLFAPEKVTTLDEQTRAALIRVRPLLVKRQQMGAVRRCHGDLHLGNIVLIEGAPVLFDAIEFDVKIATTDVLYDLAFLLMDLVARGLQPAANILLNRYLTERRRDDDFDMLAALPLFLSIRAAIRAKVTAARAKTMNTDKQRSTAKKDARRYFALAQSLLAPAKPRCVALGGLSGTGKSLMARRLAPELPPAPGAVVLRSDVTRKQLFGKHETEKLPPEGYAKEVNMRVYATLAANARRVLAAGHSIVVDAVFVQSDERQEMAQAAAGHQFHGLFLTTDLATRIARVSARTADASDAGSAIAQAQEAYGLGLMDWTEVDASGAPDETLRRVKATIKGQS